MTKQHELLELAGKHQSNPMVRLVMLSITEGRMLAREAFALTQSTSATLALAADFQPGYGISADHSDFVAAAAKGAAAMARLHADCSTLACVLQELGETVNY